MKLKDIQQHESIWTPDKDGNIDVSGCDELKEQGNLVGAPSVVEGHFMCASNQLTSLKGAPKIIKGNFGCQFNRISSLQYMPEQVYGDVNLNDNNITSLHNIHKHLKHAKSIRFGAQPSMGLGHYFTKSPTHILGVCLIHGLKEIWCNSAINALFKKHGDDIIAFQDALIDAGYIEQAKL